MSGRGLAYSVKHGMCLSCVCGVLLPYCVLCHVLACYHMPMLSLLLCHAVTYVLPFCMFSVTTCVPCCVL